MRKSQPREHLDDERLLAYLDGELDNARLRATQAHLDICWKCRSALAELEVQAETISRLLAQSSDDLITRSALAREKFLQWRNAFEAKRRFFFGNMPPQKLRYVVHGVLA